MNILAIGAHPDDIEFGCGGTLARYTGAGHRVTMLVITGGEQGGVPTVRQKEAQGAADILGAAELILGGYEDTRVPLTREFISFLEDVLRKVQPQMIFVHHGHETHQDHRTVHTAVLSAARYVPNLLFYEGPTTMEFQPTIFVDIRAALDKKMRALEAHASQVQKTNIPNTNVLEMARATAVFRGTQGRVPAAEAFRSARLFLEP
ncbi:MAG: PIG-L family deacetylase [Candidatus Tectomicrobia bacterium]|nr:PIG-L family deacetylase [Candidatus Tectomicrobia bacterium]